MESIIQREKKCFFCGKSGALESHHCIGGNPGRKNSEKYGLKVWLCGDFTANRCHRGKNGPHQNPIAAEHLHKVAQIYFEKEHGRDEWMRIFGRNYLDE